jgi:hypothetical protein
MPKNNDKWVCECGSGDLCPKDSEISKLKARIFGRKKMKTQDKLTIRDKYGDWVEPFQLTTNMLPVACKFCQSRYEKVHHCNRDFTSEQKKHFYIPKGSKCIKLVVSNGPTATSFICLKCAEKLIKNLYEQL